MTRNSIQKNGWGFTLPEQTISLAYNITQKLTWINEIGGVSVQKKCAMIQQGSPGSEARREVCVAWDVSRRARLARAESYRRKPVGRGRRRWSLPLLSPLEARRGGGGNYEEERDRAGASDARSSQNAKFIQQFLLAIFCIIWTIIIHLCCYTICKWSYLP